MGNSRVMFVAAVSAMLGLYSLGIKKADQSIQSIPMTQAFRMQAKEISKAGVQHSVTRIRKSKAGWEVVSRKPFMRGYLTYTVIDYTPYGWNYIYVSSEGEYKGQKVQTSALLEQWKNNQFRVVQESTKTSTSNGDYTGLESSGGS